MRILMVFGALAIFTSACAEGYMGIEPLDTLGDIENKFPDAKVEKLSPVWAQATDALYKFTGTGGSGWIVIKFDDYRPKWKEAAGKNPTSKMAELFQYMSRQTDEKALSVNWVRWFPAPIPVQRLISKYGKPEKNGFSGGGYHPYRIWDKKGVVAYLSDDEKYVVRVDFYFTREEYRKAYSAKFGFLPDWLEDKHREPGNCNIGLGM